VKFEWDPAKAAANMRRHGVSFEEASSVFGDSLARTFADPDHSDSAEERELTFGTSAAGGLSSWPTANAREELGSSVRAR